MIRDNKLKTVFGIVSIGLLILLIIKLNYIPGGMILSGLFLGGMILIGTILACVTISSILRFVFKSISFLTLFTITTTISLLVFHYKLYSPTLKIIVPNEYYGTIHMVRSNLKGNILTVDSNGVGYLTEWTFSQTYTEPIIERFNGEKVKSEVKWYNRSTFWGRGRSCCMDGKSIESLSFKILPENVSKETWYDKSNLLEIVNENFVVFTEVQRPR